MGKKIDKSKYVSGYTFACQVMKVICEGKINEVAESRKDLDYGSKEAWFRMFEYADKLEKEMEAEAEAEGIYED